MKERLLQLLDMEHLTPSKFADLIGVQRSSVSHILSGRNKPSYDFLHKTLTTFPGLKADWLMLGQGHIYEHMGRESSNLFDQPIVSNDSKEIAAVDAGEELALGAIDNSPESDDSPVNPLAKDIHGANLKPESPSESRKIVQVMVFYDDDTFSTFRPSQ